MFSGLASISFCFKLVREPLHLIIVKINRQLCMFLLLETFDVLYLPIDIALILYLDFRLLRCLRLYGGKLRLGPQGAHGRQPTGQYARLLAVRVDPLSCIRGLWVSPTTC